MKPRNAEERAVVKMSNRLAPISLRQTNWMCGQLTEATLAEFAKTKKKVENYCYYGIVTTHDNWQVTRYFLGNAYISNRSPLHICYLAEISQRWMQIDSKGHMHLHILERRKGMNWYWRRNPYCLSSPIELKTWGMGYNRGGRTEMCLADEEIYPVRRFAPSIVEHGLQRLIGRYDEIALCINQNYDGCKRALTQYPVLALDRSKAYAMPRANYLPTEYETLYKIGERGLAMARLNGMDYTLSGYITRYWKSFLVARRHGLRNLNEQAWRDWFEYVHDLETIGRDIHSPKYLCPMDVGVAHGKVIDQITKERRRLADEKAKAEALKWEEVYAKNMSRYFGLHFESKNIVVETIKSVADIEAEGSAMHHCVFTNGYYKKADSLILSARNRDGGRVETIEVGLKSFKIMQSRGVCNKSTEYHDEIVSLVESKMSEIRKIRVSA